MNTFFAPFDLRVDLEPIIQEITKVVDLFGWGLKNHLALVHPWEDDQNVHRDTASRRDWANIYPGGMRMSRYCHFNKHFKDGAIHQFYQNLAEVIPEPIARLRIARIQPFHTYSFHNDEEIRYHLAVLTHPHCFFLVSKQGRDSKNMPVYPNRDFTQPDLEVFHVPADGQVYRLDANHCHTAINSSSLARIHLLVETVSPLNDRLFINE